MLSSSRQALRRAAAPQALAAATRGIGAQGVPEEWGQPRTGGTQFLGTPDNYLKLLKKRPVSPDLFGVEGGAHYKVPPVALSSITNRVTGVVLSGVVIGGGVTHLVTDLPALVDAIKALGPAVTVPLKFGVAFPVVYHTLGGFRHLIWDYTLRGIDNASADTSSKVLFAASFAASAALAATTLS